MKKKLKLLPAIIFAMMLFFNVQAQNNNQPHSLGSSKSLLNSIKKKEGGRFMKTKASAMELPVSPTTSLNAKVNFKKSEASSEFIVGEIEDVPQSSFYIQVNEGALEGNIILRASKKAYKYFSDEEGNAFVKEVDINDLICIDYDNKPKSSAKETAITAEIGQAVLSLQSLPGGNGCVLLDVDGHYMPAGNLWNGGNAINASSSGMSDAAIQELWEVVSEDFRPFNLNITTSESVFNSYPRNRRMRCVITPTNTAAPGAGGVAYIGSFNWDNDVPCWVFITAGKSGGEASSHEIGHTFGLGHDGRTNPSEGYFAGHGDWAPIMGVGYYRNITQWSKGEYNYSNNTEDDLAKISSSTYGVGYRNDDHGNGTGNATNLTYNSSGAVNQANGIIERTGDLDFFKFTTGGGNISLNVNTVSRHGDLDILVRLYNASGSQIGTFNPGGLNSTVTASLAAGTYYISVDGTGSGNPATDGYSDYASLGTFRITGTIPPGGGVTPSGPAVVTVYKDCNFGGYSVGLEEGDYTLAELNARGISNDDVSSLKVSEGFKAILYNDNNYGGSSLTVTGDNSCLVANSFNDITSSIKIRANGVTNLAGTYTIQNRNSGLYMDVWGYSTSDGGQINQGNYHGGTNQQFELVHLGDGIYRINAKISSKSFDISGVSTENEARLIQWTYVGGKNQQFIAINMGSGYYKLMARHSLKILDVTGAATNHGAKIAQWWNHNGTNAQWKFNKVTTTPAFSVTIQAENYSNMAGVQTETTTDTGGGLNVGYIEAGDWMAYFNINFPSSGAYKVEYRVASVSGSQLSLDLNAGSIQLGAVNIPATGGWQNWTTVSHTVNINAGTYNLGVYAQAGGWNINWIKITKVDNAAAASAIIASAAAAPLTNGSSGSPEFEVYPNPAVKEIIFNTNYDLTGAVLKIYDSNGIVVMEAPEPANGLDVSHLGHGIYTLVVYTKDNTKIVKRIVKN